MTPSQKIIIDAGKALRERVLSISDDLEFNQFRRDVFDIHNLSTADLGRIAGIASEHIMGKRYAGTAAAIKAQGQTPPAELVANGAAYAGRALTVAEHGDPDAPDLDAWWLANCPAEYRVYLLAQHIDAPADPVRLFYAWGLDREPDAKGLAFWTDRLAGIQSEQPDRILAMRQLMVEFTQGDGYDQEAVHG